MKNQSINLRFLMLQLNDVDGLFSFFLLIVLILNIIIMILNLLIVFLVESSEWYFRIIMMFWLI